MRVSLMRCVGERFVRSGCPIRRDQTGRCMRHEDDGAPDTARRGGPCMRHEDEWTYAADCARTGRPWQQRVPSRAPTGGPELLA